jgi:hypothetical protein
MARLSVEQAWIPEALRRSSDVPKRPWHRKRPTLLAVPDRHRLDP